jgi:single-stranded DNA-binding protein
MIDGLVSGRLYGTSTSRTGAKVRATAGDGEALFVNVIAFDDTAKSALLALGDGDSVALAGTLTPKAWVDRAGEAKPALDLVAHAVLSAYDVKRRRATVQATRQPANGAEQASRMYGGGAASDFDDDL